MKEDLEDALEAPQDGLDTRFCEAMDAAPVMMWVSGQDKLCTWFNQPWLSFTGRTLAQERGNGWVDGVHTADLDRCLETYVSHFNDRKQFRMQYRLRHRDGDYRWIDDIGIPRHARDGSFLGYIGSAIDIHDQKTVEEELRRVKTALEQREEHIAADLRDMTRLNRLSNQLVRGGADLHGCLNEVLDTAIALSGADKGSVQLLDTVTGTLTMAAQRGFQEPFLKFFASVQDDASACGAGMRKAERVIVEDITTSTIFAGQLSQNVLIDAGVRAVISTPLLSSTGLLLGMVSTHFAEPHRPNERELHLVDLLARQTADYLERKRAEETTKTLNREIQHRSNNLLAVMQTIAHRSLSDDRSVAEAREAFEARLQALARTNRRLTQANWGGLNLSDIVRLELEPFAARTTIDGISVMLSPQRAQNFSLALHELATNAAKHGALSNGTGKIEVSWTVVDEDRNRRLRFRWRERGGPPVVTPTRHGFGTSLLKAAFTHARFDYAPDGLTCQFDVLLGDVRVGASGTPAPEKLSTT